MRVLHIDTGATMQGGQWQVLYLLKGLAGRGIASRLLAPERSELLTAARESGCDAQPLRKLGVVQAARDFDLVHAHDARSHTLALALKQPLVISRRVAFAPKRTLLSRYKYSRPARYLAVSRYVERVLIEAGIPESKISVVYDGVDVVERVDANRASVIALDSDSPGKGKAAITQAASAAGIPVSFSRILRRDLANAWLFVYITELEGLGSAALLAMAHAVPVLASRAGGLPEIVQHGITGLLTGNDPDEIAAALRALDADRAACAGMGRNGQRAVRDRFSVAHMVENTVRAYEQVLAC